MDELAARRLAGQGLVGEPAPSAVAVVGRMGAVQAQDFPAARWALGLRARSVTEAEVDRLLDEGALLRTHVMRPTWHLVLPERLRGLLTLTGRRIVRSTASRQRNLELDPPTIRRAAAIFASELEGGRHRTRAELGEALVRAGISPEGQRLPHLLMYAELEQVVVSGARRGRQHTYALFDERVPAASGQGRDEIAAELAATYFRSHGPAGLADFAWWSGLPLRECRAAVDQAGDALASEMVGDVRHWFDPRLPPVAAPRPVAHLLPNFDEYTVAYRDRAHALPGFDFDVALFPFASLLSNVLVVDGRVRGAWTRAPARGGLRVDVRLLAPLEAAEREAVELAAARLAEFTGGRVDLAGVG